MPLPLYRKSPRVKVIRSDLEKRFLFYKKSVTEGIYVIFKYSDKLKTILFSPTNNTIKTISNTAKSSVLIVIVYIWNHRRRTTWSLKNNAYWLKIYPLLHFLLQWLSSPQLLCPPNFFFHRATSHAICQVQVFQEPFYPMLGFLLLFLLFCA